MSEVILWEVHLFIKSLLLGMGLRAGYDLLLILRGLKYAGNMRIAIEDLIYWMVCCYFVFGMLYEENNGSPRGFAIIGVFIGMAVYHFGPSSIIVPQTVRIMQKTGRILKKIVKKMYKPLKKIYTWFTIKK